MEKNTEGLDKVKYYYYYKKLFTSVQYVIMQIIALGAGVNKLSKIQECEEYAALIMEELDEDNLGYIEVSS